MSDFSPGMLQEAQQNLNASHHSFKFAVIDAQSIPFAAESLDAVIANHMLYHVPNRKKAFSEIHRILRPGGRFYAATNGRIHLRQLGELVRKFDPNARGNDDRSDSGVLTSKNFSLENGQAQLSTWFSKITLSRYEDALIITEVEPLIAWAKSWAKRIFIGNKLDEFIRFLVQEMTLQGTIHVTKDSGMFEAFRPTYGGWCLGKSEL